MPVMLDHLIGVGRHATADPMPPFATPGQSDFMAAARQCW